MDKGDKGGSRQSTVGSRQLKRFISGWGVMSNEFGRC